MSSWLKSLLVAGYVFLCILFGGSAQGVWTNLSLQVGGVVLIAVAAVAPREAEDAVAPSPFLRVLLACALVLVLLQLIPIPADAWTRLPGRELIVSGLAALEYQLPLAPVSMSPYHSLITLFAFIPAVATYVTVQILRPSPSSIAIAVLAGTILGVIVGAWQSASGPGSWAYFYPISSSGAVGFFANKNHMATLLLVAIPVTAALMASGRSDRRSKTNARYAIGVSIFVLIAVGIALNGSFAALGLAIPVIIASVAILPVGFRWRRFVVPLGALVLVAGVALLSVNPIGSDVLQRETSTSVNSRTAIWSKTVEAVRDSFPVGTGLGTFRQVYDTYEDHAKIDPDYVNHAHNDYLELALELGLPGLILIALFLGWWSILAVRIWVSPLSTPIARAATVVTAAVLAHSVVDFPLRTAAISVIFAAFIGLMAQPGELRSGRHIRLG